MVNVPLTATYSVGGTYGWVCPPGVTSVACVCIGAGGGSGPGNATTGSNGGGGGGGEAAYEPAIPVTPGTSYLVIVGNGGIGGNTSTGAASTAGGNSQFAGDNPGTTGSVAVIAHGGSRGAQSTTGGGPGGNGGTGSTNTVSASGGAGDDGTFATNGGGGGGAGGVSTTAGFPGNNAVGSVAGAHSLGTYQGGAGGAGATTGAIGSNGNSPGGGAGGSLSTGVAKNGANGADGQVIIIWTMPDPVVLPNSTSGGVWKFQAPLGVTAVKAEAVGAGAGGFNNSGSATQALVGASAFTAAYGSPRSAAATTYDNRVGRPMATNVQVTYYIEEQYPSSAADDQQATADLTAMGAGIIASFRLSRRAVVAGGATLTTQQNLFAAALNYLVAVPGIQLRGVCLGNEPGLFGQHGPFGDGSQKDWNKPNPYGTPTKAQTAANYLAYWAAFQPTAFSILGPLGIPILFKPTVTSQDMSILMFPGAPSSAGGCDGVIIDWYSLDAAPNTPFGAGNMEATCDAAGVGLGLGEWGAAGGNTGPTLAQWNTFITTMVNGFTNRFNNNKPVLDAIYFGGLSTTGQNVVQSSSDFKVPGIQQVYDLFSSASSKVGGTGGGGGEYAAEATLALTSNKTYTLVVGNGGSQKKSGANTTVAGDSVTVTAHGGSAATNTSTGGAGGTGSTNTTHNNGGAGGAGGVAGTGGAGGGSSGGSASAGNAGSTGTSSSGGTGGAAVTGGGPGGKGGGPNGNGATPATGPGGGGGARGANGSSSGSGFDGQITLSNFVTGTVVAGNVNIGPLGANGISTLNSGNVTMGSFGANGTVSVGGWSLVQNGVSANSSGGQDSPVIQPSKAGTTLIFIGSSNSQTAYTTTDSRWTLIKAQNTGGASGRIEMWMMPGDKNTGGITGNSWSGPGVGHIMEFAPPAGTIGVIEGVAASTSGGAPTTSFPLTYGSSTTLGDLAIIAFEDQFSPGPSGNPWVTPVSGFTTGRSQGGGITNSWISAYNLNEAAGTVSVTVTANQSTNQIGFAGILVLIKPVTLVSSNGLSSLSSLTAAATGSSQVPANTVVSNASVSLGGLTAQSPSQVATVGQQGNSTLPIVVEILVNNSWTDITFYVYQRDNISITSRGRPNEASTAQPTQVTLTLNNGDGSFSPQNANGQFYPYLVRNTQIRVSINSAVTPTGANYSGYRFWGEVPAWPPQWDPSGRDVYVTLTAVGVLQRMQQSKYSASPITRYYTNIMNQAINSNQTPGSVPIGVGLVPAGYWPCEDSVPTAIPALKGLQSLSFASGIPGGSPMTWTGSPGLASDSSVLGSEPFAQLNGSVWVGKPGAFSSGGLAFQNPGTYQWVCPDGVTSIKVECWGGGGGGGGIDCFGQGGGGGEYARENNVAVTPGNTYTIKVGIGGDGSKGGGPGAVGTQGGDGFRSTFVGDNVTVIAHGGQGAHTHISVAAGGTGSNNTTHFDGGNGADWPNNGQFGGEGGGGSGGTASAGNNGQHNNTSNNSGGAGGAAVAGGGPGGAGGQGYNGGSGGATGGLMPSPGPGGGGGGGGFNNFSNYRRAGGGGQPGQVVLTFGTSTRPTANVIRALIDVPSGGGLVGAQYIQAVTGGTVHFLNFTYQGTGHFELRGRDVNNNLLFDSGSQFFVADGNPFFVSIELTKNKTDGTKLNWKLTAISPGASSPFSTTSGSVTATMGSVTQINVNNAAGNTETAAVGVGQVSVQYQVDAITNISNALNAYVGELASDRFTRLCEEQNVPVTVMYSNTDPNSGGSTPDTPVMGPQPVGLLVDLLQDCENVDLGQMFERRDAFGLGYVTRTALQNQSAVAILDYNAAHLAQGILPTNDEQLVRNDIVATRGSGNSSIGTSYEAIQMSGPLSVLDPPNGVGLYQDQVTVNVQNDTQLQGFTAWLLTLGTLDEYRYPIISVDLMRAEVSDGTFGAVPTLDIGDMIIINNPPSWLPPYPINQLCFGFTETLNAFTWLIQINAVPADPYLSNSPLPTW